MKIKMKKCIGCGQLLSNSAKKCFKCNSVDLAKGTISDGNSDIPTVASGNERNYQCSVCKCPVRLMGKRLTVECQNCGALLILDENTIELNEF